VNVHTHALVLDGVFAEDATGTLVFHPAPPPEGEALDALLATIARRIERLLTGRGAWTAHAESAASDPWADEVPVLAGLAVASVRRRLAPGPRAGGEVRRCGTLRDEPPLPLVRDRATPCTADSISMPESSFPRATVRTWNASAATPPAPDRARPHPSDE
jgi:hypothetical protein